MNDLSADLLAVLRSRTDTPTLDYAEPPRPLTGGFWAELLAFRLRSAPDRLIGELVARVMPDPVLAAKETAIQTEVARQGYPTPAVRLAGGPGDGLGRAYMVMDRADGAPLLAGLDGVGAITALPRLFARIPDVLATAMADLHRLDIRPVRAALAAVDNATLSVPALLEALSVGAQAHGRGELAQAADWLAAHPPLSAPEVVCHGDLHPFNLLVDDTGAVTVLDWSASMLAPVAYDAAFTSLMLAEPPIAVPRMVRPLVQAGGRLLARRFLRRYRRHGGLAIDADSLRWHQSLVCLRALLEVAWWAGAGELEDKAGHPWLVSGPAFATRLAKLTGALVRPR